MNSNIVEKYVKFKILEIKYLYKKIIKVIFNYEKNLNIMEKTCYYLLKKKYNNTFNIYLS